MSACNKGAGTPEDSTPEGLPISFNAGEASTKAGTATLDDIKASGFKVWGWLTSLAHPDGIHAFDQTGTSVTYDSDNSAWTYSPVRYWMNGIYDFAAVYPSTVTAAYGSSDNSEQPALTVTDFDVTGQDDLMVALNTDVDGSQRASNNPIRLNFRHLLTKINLKIQQDFSEETGDPENDYLIKSVTIGGVKYKCSYVATPSGTAEHGYNDSWTIDNSTTSFVKEFETPIKLRDNIDEENNILPLLVWDDALLQIPQEIVFESVSLKIVYIYRLNGDTNGEKDRERTFETFIPATKNLWKSGNHIVYTISIANPSSIVLLTSKIEPWILNQPGGTIIIN